MLQVSALFIYPIKSLGGVAVNKGLVTDRGFKYDRRWMLVDDNNRFMTQREFAKMALIKVEITDGGLHTTYLPENYSIAIPFAPQKNEFAEVVIWDDTCKGQFVSDDVDEWFSKVLGTHCRLVYMPDDSERITDQQYAPEGSITSLSDGFPFLLIGQSSLDDLNHRLNEALPIDRFRPNIVFTGGAPFLEDAMDSIIINNIHFKGVKLCARCTITTINQTTSEKNKEPLKTLAAYRLKDNKILFGQNLVHEGLGEITIGDPLEVLREHTEARFTV